MLVVVVLVGGRPGDDVREEAVVVYCLLAGGDWVRLVGMAGVVHMRLLLGIVGRAVCRRTRGAAQCYGLGRNRLQCYIFWLSSSTSIPTGGFFCHGDSKRMHECATPLTSPSCPAWLL